MVTPATSVSFFRSEFNDFLYAPIGADRNEMPLSVLSALTRLNLDPWKEAAELSELPKGAARQRLAALIARLPGGRWASADLGPIADRLIEFLPHHGLSKVSLASKGHGLRGMTGAAVTKILIFAAQGSLPSSLQQAVNHYRAAIMRTRRPSATPPHRRRHRQFHDGP